MAHGRYYAQEWLSNEMTLVWAVFDVNHDAPIRLCPDKRTAQHVVAGFNAGHRDGGA